jgi:hypothetical protein
LADDAVFLETSFFEDESFVLEDMRPSFLDLDDLFSLLLVLRDSLSESEACGLSMAHVSGNAQKNHCKCI